MLSATMVFCGVTFPVSMLPGGAQIISRMLPLTYGIEAARLAAVGQVTGIPTLLLYEIIIGVILFCLGSLALIYFEHLARKRGQLVFF